MASLRELENEYIALLKRMSHTADSLSGRIFLINNFDEFTERLVSGEGRMRELRVTHAWLAAHRFERRRASGRFPGTGGGERAGVCARPRQGAVPHALRRRE